MSLIIFDMQSVILANTDHVGTLAGNSHECQFILIPLPNRFHIALVFFNGWSQDENVACGSSSHRFKASPSAYFLPFAAVPLVKVLIDVGPDPWVPIQINGCRDWA